MLSQSLGASLIYAFRLVPKQSLTLILILSKIMKVLLSALILSMALSPLFAADVFPKSPSPKGARAYIISPRNGATVKSPVRVRFGLVGMGVAPAGVDIPDTGHHHLIIDTKDLPNLDAPLPASDNLKHFGKGQTEAKIELAPGKHTLRLVLGDKIHLPHSPAVISKEITITVE